MRDKTINQRRYHDALMILHVNYMWPYWDTINRNFIKTNRHYYFDSSSIDETTIDNTIDNFYLIFRLKLFGHAHPSLIDSLIDFSQWKKFPLGHLLGYLSIIIIFEAWNYMNRWLKRIIIWNFICTCFNNYCFDIRITLLSIESFRILQKMNKYHV